MERFTFTKQNLAQLRPNPKAVLVGDAEVPGLKLKIPPRSKRAPRRTRKTFLLEKRIKGCKGSAVTFTLGTFPNMHVDQARQKAREYANLCEQGLDPREKERELKARLCKHSVITFASIGNYLGLPMLTLKRLINHHYQGGVTGGYVVESFDPQQNRQHFQAIANFIVTKRDEHLGISTTPDTKKLAKLRAYAASLGLGAEDLAEVMAEPMKRPA